jgi:hypothetical protein
MADKVGMADMVGMADKVGMVVMVGMAGKVGMVSTVQLLSCSWGIGLFISAQLLNSCSTVHNIGEAAGSILYLVS